MDSSKPSGAFLDDARWDRSNNSVSFSLLFLEKDDAEKIPLICKVSSSALEYLRKSPVRANKSAIESAVDRKVMAMDPKKWDLVLAQREIRIEPDDLD